MITKFNKEVFKHSQLNGGEQYIFKFGNSYGASVIKHDFSYGSEDDLWELAVLKFEGDKCRLDYSTEIPDDVLGRLDEEVNEILTRIENLEEDN